VTVSGDRLGFSLYPSRTVPVDAVVRLAQEAESLGYHSIWIPETWGIDAVSVLAVLAASTKRICLASGVFNVYSRTPAVIAQTAATLQTLSEGRFLLGLGVSGPTVIEHWHGLPFGHPLQQTRRTITAVRRMLAGERVDMWEETSESHGFILSNAPASMPPIFLAALGPRNVGLAGELADGWLPIFASRQEDDSSLVAFRQGALRAGREPAGLEVAAFLPVASGMRGEEQLRRHLAYYIGAMGTFYAEHARRLGFDEAVQSIRSAWSSGARRHAVNLVPTELLAVTTLGTDPAGARERLEDYRRAGITIPVAAFPHGCSESEIARALVALIS
jgi:F420-dependent oxidoreductase-like protein